VHQAEAPKLTAWRGMFLDCIEDDQHKLRMWVSESWAAGGTFARIQLERAGVCAACDLHLHPGRGRPAGEVQQAVGTSLITCALSLIMAYLL
jgi:hypothetical protein